MADPTLIGRAADSIEPYITGTFKRRQRAEGNARDLADAGLLRGGHSPSVVSVLAQVEAVLHCRHGWKTAEKIAAELQAAGLIKGDDRG